MGRKSHAYVQELEPVCIGSGEEERFPFESKVLVSPLGPRLESWCSLGRSRALPWPADRPHHSGCWGPFRSGKDDAR